MTAVKGAAAPSGYRSGHCAARAHERCRGAYAGCECTCDCHTAPPEPEPEVLGEIAAALTELGTATAVAEALVQVRHCPTCTCGGAA